MNQTSLTLVLFLTAFTSTLPAQDAFPAAGDESAKFRSEVVIEGLDNPCGLTLRPTSDRDARHEFLFAESGAGRVLGFQADKPKETREVVTDLTVVEVTELDARASAWSLGFVTPTKLAVFGGMKAGSDRVGVYILPIEQVSLTADQQDHEVLIAENESVDSKPVLPGMAFGDTTAFFSNGSVNLPGQIYHSGLAANRIEMPQPLLNTAESHRSRWPTAVCLSPSSEMQFLVTAFAGELAEARDSRLVFLIPVSGKLSLDLMPGLIDIVGLAYSASGQLYAIDLAWRDEDAGGVYRLDDARYNGQPACRAVKIATAVRPTSLLFGPDGALYVTSWGKGSDAKHGTVIKVTGEF